MKVRILKWEQTNEPQTMYYISIKLDKDNYFERLNQFANLLSISKQDLLNKIKEYEGQSLSLVMSDKEKGTINLNLPDYLCGFTKRKNAQRFVDEVVTPKLILDVLTNRFE
jgi:hypothetical protein